MKKTILIALSIVGLLASFTLSRVIARDSDGEWSNPNPEKWGACVQTACGSDKGTQTQTITCRFDRGENECTPAKWECPTDASAYTSNDDDKECDKWIDGHKKYADKVMTQAADTKEVTRDCTVKEVKACETPVVAQEPQQPQSNGFGLPGDGRSDGKSDGRSSCPECTAPPKTNGQVLGASTDFAGTGVIDNIIMNVVGVLGGISTAAGLVMKSIKK